MYKKTAVQLHKILLYKGVDIYNKMGYLPEVVRIIAAHVGSPSGAKAIGTGFFLAVDGKLISRRGPFTYKCTRRNKFPYSKDNDYLY